MAVVLKSLARAYKEFYHDAQDPRTTDLFLMNPPWLPVTIVGLYLYFVLNLGPKWMASRNPLNIKTLILVYNVVQVAINTYMAYTGTKLFIKLKFSLTCQPVNRSAEGLPELNLVHQYYLLKVLDLVDTIFFVVRKKQTHVSFLHVYHHAAMVLGPFIYSRAYPGGHGSMLGLINTYVHAVMYLYYFLSAYKPELVRDIRWKKYITGMQIAQFIFLTGFYGNTAIMGYDCGIPIWWFWACFIQAIFMLAMFSDFYYRTYVKANKIRKSL
ncbi:elongation of very long chain fatty acids protein AAEL008004-like [Uranotaenia lowii]|uniref:elongation of very long chain fatty acids protein AAEL008004-like n=1 Tax=Uranotaenia lowii TaxID=190385 RepID=UPI00247AF9FE|nr:elongation of very long chain fatty acids protein AAEL008004-like [Uranotaenia lowii]XP_055608257.1 elongation of very long chain fatty acids protein AAEL008004-like [Uranotaenia lowii]